MNAKLENFAEQLKKTPVYPGYPSLSERKTLTLNQYEAWVHYGRPDGTVIGVNYHDHYLMGLDKGLALGTDRPDFFDLKFAPTYVHGGYPRDAIGRPVHPYAEVLLTNGLAVEGIGHYWTLGPQLCADSIVIGCDPSGAWKAIVVQRRDTGAIALPGGHVEAEEVPFNTALRELREETSACLSKKHLLATVTVYQGPVADSRTTLNAWPESTFYMFLVDNINELRPVAGDDAKDAFIAEIDDQFYTKIIPCHAEPIRTAVRSAKEILTK